ncbi:MAG: hypothetical protein ACRC6A_06400 [Fusobacteriaceae bacterium]
MKKIISIIYFFVFILSFGNPLKDTDVDLLKRNLLLQDYSMKQGDSGDYLFFNTSQGKYKQRVTLYIPDKELLSLKIVSSHFTSNPDKEFINDNLKKVLKIIKSSLKNKNLIIKIDTLLNKINKTDSFDFFEEKDYSIRTTNLEKEESIEIRSEILDTI